jgi:hypothetical protein
MVTPPAMAGLDPTGSRGFAVEVETAASSHTAIVRTEADKGRLGTPGKRLLLGCEYGKGSDDLINSAGMHELHGGFTVSLLQRVKTVNTGDGERCGVRGS